MKIKIKLTEANNKQVLNEIEILKKIGSELKTSTKFITTFGTGVAAFYPAISRMLENSSLSLTKEEIILLIITSFSVLAHSDEAEKLKKKAIVPTFLFVFIWFDLYSLYTEADAGSGV